MSHSMELLAPAGNMESLIAAVQCGADAVYLGGKILNARRSAANFGKEELAQAVAYCHARGVAVHLAMNTVVFDEELPAMLEAIGEACECGVDAAIVQDLAVAAAIRKAAPGIALHASTQMAIHNLEGAKLLEQLGFSRVVLAREMSAEEIRRVVQGTNLEVEVFVHGAQCMCVSGQCYFSSALGGRSGNRGVCAQPCRLPFEAGHNEYALSLKDLSLLDKIRGLKQTGVCSLKIEGRMKRPEYVAAAVTACRKALEGEPVDFETLRAVFSRSGFTSGYFDGKLGTEMFGTRNKSDVVSANSVLNSLAGLYRNENGRVPVDFDIAVRSEKPLRLTAKDVDGNTATAQGEAPQVARTAPTDEEKLTKALAKTGGTIFVLGNLTCQIDDGLMVPVSQLNALRRQVLEEIEAKRSRVQPHPFYPERFALPQAKPAKNHTPKLRAIVADIGQITPAMWQDAEFVIIPAEQIARLPQQDLAEHALQIMLEVPRVLFDDARELHAQLQYAKEHGITHAWVANAGSIVLAQQYGMQLHGGYALNITNKAALEEYAALGLTDAEASFELELAQVQGLCGGFPVGMLAYGHLPLMITRNAPGGQGFSRPGSLIDRKGNKFSVRPKNGAYEVENCVPLYLADRLRELRHYEFLALKFTAESPTRCAEILREYHKGGTLAGDKTRGLYYRKVM